MINIDANPNIRRCNFGHYYEIKKHAECPYCKDEYKKQNDTIVVNTYSEDIDGSGEKTEILFLDR